MHDPMTVAFDLCIPAFWKKPGKFGWRGHLYLITIWHRDPETDGSDDSCRWFVDGRPWWRHPRFHIWHWRVQVHFIQKLRRCLFERCVSCGKRYRWGYSPTRYKAASMHRECSAREREGLDRYIESEVDRIAARRAREARGHVITIADAAKRGGDDAGR